MCAWLEERDKGKSQKNQRINIDSKLFIIFELDIETKTLGFRWEFLL